MDHVYFGTFQMKPQENNTKYAFLLYGDFGLEGVAPSNVITVWCAGKFITIIWEDNIFLLKFCLKKNIYI